MVAGEPPCISPRFGYIMGLGGSFDQESQDRMFEKMPKRKRALDKWDWENVIDVDKSPTVSDCPGPGCTTRWLPGGLRRWLEEWQQSAAFFLLVSNHQTAPAGALVFWAAVNNQQPQLAVRRLGPATVLVLLG
ncbi:hypothetical protein E3N88_29542 [Mikania micrantha]|uniref:Uncharacterized protein n=1 Tax=Mikania micrantha TaxID=192012 RepID=A0A5N6MK10_9ASTR|nr:hypothetical protein E3N88_29542 [Mikania micrantha]